MAYKGQVDLIIIKLDNLLTHQSYHEHQQAEDLLREEDGPADAAARPATTGSTTLSAENDCYAQVAHGCIHPQSGNSIMTNHACIA